MKKAFSIRSRLRSFSYAISGIRTALASEWNMRIHVFVTICVIIAGIVFSLSLIEWIAVVFAIGMVLSLELINTAIEYCADFVSPKKHETIKKVKDISAGAVLIGAITAAAIGVLIFVPKIMACVH
ncbi:MAG: diacylglycerol kinase family protein [Bacteroidota bacterium]